MCSEAAKTGRELEVVLEPITDWDRPWARGQTVFVEQGLSPWSALSGGRVQQESLNSCSLYRGTMGARLRLNER